MNNNERSVVLAGGILVNFYKFDWVNLVLILGDQGHLFSGEKLVGLNFGSVNFWGEVSGGLRVNKSNFCFPKGNNLVFEKSSKKLWGRKNFWRVKIHFFC
jgi:hypothetical protein